MKDLLIVEDDPTLGEGIRLALQAPELRPQLCRSLADAGELLSRRSFDLLILDINLPDGNGLDLLRALRREQRRPGDPADRQRPGDGHRGRAGAGGGRLYHQALLPGGAAGQGEHPAAPGPPPAQAERVQMDGFTFDFGRMEFSPGRQFRWS